MRGVLVTMLIGVTSACAAPQYTPAQERAQAAWDACVADGRIPPEILLSRIDPDGRLWFRTSADGTIGWAEVRACVAEKRRAIPR